MTPEHMIIEEDESHSSGMTVSEIIAVLSNLDPDHIPTVLVWNSEYESYFAKPISEIEVDPSQGLSGRARLKL